MSDTAGPVPHNPNAARIREINDSIRYAMWSVFAVAEPIGDEDREALATEVEELFTDLAERDVVVRGTYAVAGLREPAPPRPAARSARPRVACRTPGTNCGLARPPSPTAAPSPSTCPAQPWPSGHHSCAVTTCSTASAPARMPSATSAWILASPRRATEPSRMPCQARHPSGTGVTRHPRV